MNAGPIAINLSTVKAGRGAPDHMTLTPDPTDTVVDGYLELGLRLGRHIDGFVDCWFGDPELARRVADEPRRYPFELAADAQRLMRDVAAIGDPARATFLAGQLRALECTARRLGGEQMTIQHEVHRYFEVEVTAGDPEYYSQVHTEISEALGGTGPLLTRMEAFHDRNAVPPDKLQRCVQAVSDALRSDVARRFGLPADEQVDYRVVTGVPWSAFNTYLGGHRSDVALNATAGRNIAALPVVVTHEAYAGHHTEHCLKEAGLLHGRAHREQAIALVNTPQCLMAEGIAERALDVVLGPGWGPWTEAVLAAERVSIDGPMVERIHGLVRRLLPARQDALLMIHDHGAEPAAATEYLRRWLLLPDDRAEQMTSFLFDPLWRAYSVTYVEGAQLVGDWLAVGSPERTPGPWSTERFATLLRESVQPSALLRELAAV
jgi:hypothetical protein